MRCQNQTWGPIMQSWKCMNCGIINFASADVCRRCQMTATAAPAAIPYLQPDVRQPQGPVQTGNLTQWPQQAAASPYAQGGGDQDNVSQGYGGSQDGGYGHPNAGPQAGGYTPQQGAPVNGYQPDPYAQNNGYPANGGYAYNGGNPNDLSPQGQGYGNQTQTDYSPAPAYAAP